MRIFRTSSSDAMFAPWLWWQMSELVNFLLCDRRFTWSEIGIAASFLPVQLPVLIQSPPAIFALSSTRSRVSQYVSTCPTSCRAWVTPAHPNDDPAISTVIDQRVSQACRPPSPDSHDVQSGSHEFSSCSCARIMEQSSLGHDDDT